MENAIITDELTKLIEQYIKLFDEAADVRDRIFTYVENKLNICDFACHFWDEEYTLEALTMESFKEALEEELEELE